MPRRYMKSEGKGQLAVAVRNSNMLEEAQYPTTQHGQEGAATACDEDASVAEHASARMIRSTMSFPNGVSPWRVMPP